MGLLSRAVLVAVSAAVLVSPAALADPVTGNPDTGTEQPQSDVQKKIAEYTKRVEKIEADVKAAEKAVDAAKTKAEAEKALAPAKELSVITGNFVTEADDYLKTVPEQADRKALDPVITRIQSADDAAKAVVAKAQKKIDAGDPPVPPKGDIAVHPGSVARGDIIVVAVFCPEGKVGNFASSVLDFVPESRVVDGQITAIGAFVKKDATPGKHTATSSCDDHKLTATFTVTPEIVTPPKKPTGDDVRRKAVIKPKGKIETGGGATALHAI